MSLTLVVSCFQQITIKKTYRLVHKVVTCILIIIILHCVILLLHIHFVVVVRIILHLICILHIHLLPIKAYSHLNLLLIGKHLFSIAVIVQSVILLNCWSIVLNHHRTTVHLSYFFILFVNKIHFSSSVGAPLKGL